MKRYPVHASVGGVLDWATAELMTDFTFPWEPGNAPRTEFRALWDTEHLHFRFNCVDEDLVLAAGATCKERVLGSDRVEIFLAQDLELNPYFCLEMEPRGDVFSYRARLYRQFDEDWQCEGLQISSSIDGSRYAVQGSLPLSTLRSLNVLKPRSPEFFAGLYRAEFSHEPDGAIHFGWMPWINPQTEKPDFHVPSSFGVFELVGYANG